MNNLGPSDSYGRVETFPTGHQLDLVRAIDLVARTRGRDSKHRYVRCHELARAIQPLLPPQWRIVDGMVVSVVQHTWLVGSDGIILDVYAPTRLPQVQLVDPAWFQRKLYVPGPRRRDIRWNVVRALRAQMEK